MPEHLKIALNTVGMDVKRIDNILHGPQMDIPIDRRGIGRMVFDKMQENKDRIFQVDVRTGEEHSYEYANARFVRTALEMKDRGIKPKDIILTCSENTMDTVFPIYGALYLNAITTTVDPSISLRDTTHLLNIVRPKLMFVVEGALELIEKALEQSGIKPEIVVIGSHKKYDTLSDFLKPHPDESTFVPDNVSDVHDTSNIFFSSGTTGLPKGVMHSHYSTMKGCIVISTMFIDPSVGLYYTSFYWISAFLLTTALILVGGKRLVSNAFTPEGFLKAVQGYKVTASFLSSTYAIQFSEEATANYKTDSLKDLLVGGSVVSERHLLNLRKYFPKTGIRTGYGQTEVGGIVTLFSKFSESLAERKPEACGLPYINIKIKIADIKTGKALGPNEKGEICVITESPFRGYCSLKTEILGSSFDKEGFLKTGDVGYYDEDNCLHFSDRLKEMFKYRSWHVVPTSIEIVIYKHPAVLETIVIGIPHEMDDHHPFAMVVLRDGCDVTEEDLLAFANERLSDREKLRAGLKIVKKFPKTCTGKIPRPSVRQIALSGDLAQLC